MINEHGIKLGGEAYEYFVAKKNGLNYCRYFYRHTDGALFSAVRQTLERCRNAKIDWLRTGHDFDQKSLETYQQQHRQREIKDEVNTFLFESLGEHYDVIIDTEKLIRYWPNEEALEAKAGGRALFLNQKKIKQTFDW